MSQRAQQIVFATLGVGLLLAAVALGLRSTLSKHDGRPSGTLEDVLEFSQRDDTNVLFILVDTLRADHLSAYGYERDTSPNIASLAEDGIRFGQHVSQSSWTKCSMASLWTSLYPARSGVLRGPNVLPDEVRHPSEIFREAGFRTAGIWRNGWIAPNFGFGQGFEYYTSPKPSKADRPRLNQTPHLSLAGTDADLIRSAFSFLRSHRDERWFLYLHMMDVHQYGFSEEEAIFGSTYLDLYDNSILWVDSLVGHLIAELEDRGVRDRTLIVFAADHGEAFGEHGSEGHARDVYGEVTTTPWILNFPFRLEPGIVVETRSANVDLWPTVFELAGLPGRDDVDGRSRVPEIVAGFSGETVSDEGLVFAHLDQVWGQDHKDPSPQLAVNSGPWRLLYTSAQPDDPQLFDKEIDPAEQRNVAAENSDVVEELTQVALEHLASEPPWDSGVQSVEIDDLQRDQLRALGYGVR